MTTISKNLGVAGGGLVKDMSTAQAEEARLARMTSGGKKPHDRGEIRKISEEFESLFLGIVLKSMRETVQKSGLLDGGNAEDIYRSMLDDEYAKMMAEQRHTGIADNIEEFLLRSLGDTVKPETAVQQAVGMKTYQQLGLQNTVKQARIEESEAPSASVAKGFDSTFSLLKSSLPKPI